MEEDQERIVISCLSRHSETEPYWGKWYVANDLCVSTLFERVSNGVTFPGVGRNKRGMVQVEAVNYSKQHYNTNNNNYYYYDFVTRNRKMGEGGYLYV